MILLIMFLFKALKMSKENVATNMEILERSKKKVQNRVSD